MKLLELKRKGATIIFSTHRMEFLLKELCEYIALIHKSEKILDGKVIGYKKMPIKKKYFEVGCKVLKEFISWIN